MQEASRIARRLSTLEDLGLVREERAPATSETIRLDRRTHKTTCGTPAMGTLVSISALARSADRGEEAVGRAVEQMHRLIGIFSRYDGSSAITTLNDHGRLDGAPREFVAVVTRALHYHQLSRRAFDISVEPVVGLFWGSLEGAAPQQPTRGEIRDALELVGSENIQMSGRKISFTKSGMGITLDGIAKGYIVDAMAHVLRDHKIENFLINAGGDIRSAGTKENRQPWTVAVQDPAKTGRFPDVIHLTDAAVATSGSYEVYFDRNRLFHHIVDAESGTSPDRHVSVSVIAPSAMAADALATGVFVLDPRSGVDFIDAIPGCACLIIDKDGAQVRSTRWPGAAPSTEERESHGVSDV